MVIKYCSLLLTALLTLAQRSSSFVVDESYVLCDQMRQKRLCGAFDQGSSIINLPELPCKYEAVALSCLEKNKIYELVNFSAAKNNEKLAAALFKLAASNREKDKLELITRSLIQSDFLTPVFINYVKNATRSELFFIDRVWDDLACKNLIDKRLIVIARSWEDGHFESLLTLLNRPLHDVMSLDLGDMVSFLDVNKKLGTALSSRSSFNI